MNNHFVLIIIFTEIKKLPFHKKEHLICLIKDVINYKTSSMANLIDDEKARDLVRIFFKRITIYIKRRNTRVTKH